MSPWAASKHLILLGLLWVAVQAGLWWHFGTGTSLEAEKYIAAARHLLDTGDFPERKYLFYALTPLLIAISLKSGIGLTGAVVLQMVLNGLATICFFRLCASLTRSHRAACATTAALILFLPLQSWNTYLFTESVFFSCILFALYAAWRLCSQPNRKHSILLVLSLLAMLTARPFGLLLLPGFMLMVLVLLPVTKRWLSVLLLAGTMVFLYLSLNRAFSGSMDWNALLPNERGETICDMPDPAHQQALNLLRRGNPVDQLAYYISHNPKHYLQLSVLRLKAFLFPWRPWNSPVHNLLLVCSMLVCYAGLFAGVGPIKRTSGKPFRILLYTMLAGYTFGITLQCDDYHNRFLMALVPVLLLIGSVGLTRLSFFRSLPPSPIR